MRYRTIVNSAGVRTANQLQYAGQLRGRFKFDAGAKLTLNANYTTGSNFIGSWNNAGIGTGSFAGRWFVKQLYAAWTPVPGLELGYGSMGLARGVSTEITTFDNDGYVVGERISLKRPARLFFEEITATRGYIGDFATPNVFDRGGRLTGGRNYYQLLVSKTFRGISASGDYSRLSGVPYLRLAISGGTPALRAVDTVRIEYYSRFGEDDGRGFAVYGEKAVHPRVNMGIGYADIDSGYLPVNADRFAQGRRVYGNASFELLPELSAQLFMTRAFDDDTFIVNRQRIDVILSYNVLAAARRRSWFR